MKFKPLLALYILLFILSCRNNKIAKDNSSTKLDSAITELDSIRKVPTNDNSNEISIPTNINKIYADDFPVKGSMFLDNKYRRVSGDIVSLDKAWFTNYSLGQALVFELYTDGFRNVIYLFDIHNIPKDLINRMELNVNSGYQATEAQKQRYYQGLLNQTKNIEQKYFKTNKGFKLGDKKVKALNVYGKPNKKLKSGGVEEYQWIFNGDYIYPKDTNLYGNPIVINSYGHDVSMFFKNDVLIGLILHNEIP